MAVNNALHVARPTPVPGTPMICEGAESPNSFGA